MKKVPLEVRTRTRPRQIKARPTDRNEYDMRTSEVLYLAADEIETRGWADRDIPADRAWGDHDVTAPVCLEGGILAAAGLASEPAPVEALERCSAYLAVRNYLGMRPYRFNDAIGRTKEEVIEVLRATALIEASRESELSDADLDAIAARFPEADVIDGRLMVDIAGETVTFVAHAPVAAPVLTVVS